MNIIEFFQMFWPQLVIIAYTLAVEGVVMNTTKQLNPPALILLTVLQYAVLFRGGFFEIGTWGHLVWMGLALYGWYDVVFVRSYQTRVYSTFTLFFTPIMILLLYYWCGFFFFFLDYMR